jgi:serine protease
VDENKVVASFSQKNSQVELSGPGVGVQSTVPRDMGFVATVSVDGTGYAGAGMQGSPAGSVSNRELVNCGLGASACAADGGKICIIERGGQISFADKVLACQNGKGSAAVIYNNEAGVLNGTLGSTTTTIPSMGISQADGQAILAVLADNPTGGVTVGVGDYDFYSGTSMATPHVAGVAALLWSHVPTAGAAAIREALQATAEDLGAAGRDTSYGFGLVRTAAALTYLRDGSGGGDDGGGGGGDDGGGDDGGGGGDDLPGITAEVGSITLSTTTRGPNTRTTATATIVNAVGGSAVSGASVTGCFSGAVNGCGTGTTNANGQVSFDSGNYRSGSVTFCVMEVTGTNIATFDSSGNCRSTP